MIASLLCAHSQLFARLTSLGRLVMLEAQPQAIKLRRVGGTALAAKVPTTAEAKRWLNSIVCLFSCWWPASALVPTVGRQVSQRPR